MTISDDTPVIGRRPQVTHPQPEENTVSPTPLSHTSGSARDNDSGVGKRPQTPGTAARELTQEEQKALQKEKNTDKQDMEIIDNWLIKGKKSNKMSLLFVVFIFITALLGLVIADSFLNAWETLVSMPKAVSYPLCVFFIICSGIVITVIGAFWWRFLHLPPAGDRIILKNIKEESATQNRLKQHRQAKEYIQSCFIQPFYENFSHTKELLENWNIKENDIQELESSLKVLCSNDTRLTHDEWLTRYCRTVHAQLRAIAQKRCSFYAKLVGVKTAISPFGFIDILAVMGNASVMAKDMMILHNRRPIMGQNVCLMVQVLVQTYIAGELQDAAAAGADEVFSGVQNTLLRTIGKGVASRAAEGTVNGIFMYNLGMRIHQYLMPVK